MERELPQVLLHIRRTVREQRPKLEKIKEVTAKLKELDIDTSEIDPIIKATDDWMNAVDKKKPTE